MKRISFFRAITIVLVLLTVFALVQAVQVTALQRDVSAFAQEAAE